MQRRDVLTGLGALALAQPAMALAKQMTPRARLLPKGFWWGTAISAYQSEGGNYASDTWVMEHVPGTSFKQPSGDGIDSYNRYAEDVALAASLGFNCYRFGIEWSRIEPEQGQWSLAELDHYKRVLEACHAHGLKPVVTYFHFSAPRWFTARGGFQAPDAPDLFARYCAKVTEHCGHLMAAATTFNEMNIGRLLSVLLPAGVDLRKVSAPMIAAASKAMAVPDFTPWTYGPLDVIEPATHAAHAKAYAAIKAGPGNFPVGISLSMQELRPVNGGEAKAAELNARLYDPWLDGAQTPSDFIGVQTYTHLLIDANGHAPYPKDQRMTEAGYAYSPEALAFCVRYAAKKSGKPVYITESGISAHDDKVRVEFLRATLPDLPKLIAEGIDLRGYMHWSLLDNFEWSSGYTQQFGLCTVDRTTFKRSPKPSAFVLGAVARANRV